MTVLFDLSAIYDHLTGIERYAINISKNIIVNHPENRYILIFKKEIHKDFEDIANQENVDAHILAPCHKLIFNQWRLMRHLYKCKADRYVFLSFESPWLFRSENIINTIHDISAWDCPRTRKGYIILYGRIGIRNAIRVSKKIITVSEFSKSRLLQRLGVASDKVEVVYNGVSEQFLNQHGADEETQREVKEKYNLPDRYLLCLSTLEPRKNMKLLIDAFLELRKSGQLDCELVLAGRKGWKLDDAIGTNREIMEKYVHVTGFVDDRDLPIVYSQAEAFVFPSIYEGFGIPVIEAMSCNTVVISSDSSSLPEVVGDAGILFENNSLEGLKQAILRVVNMSDEEKAGYKHKGQKRFRQFSWEKEAERLHSILKDE